MDPVVYCAGAASALSPAGLPPSSLEAGELVLRFPPVPCVPIRRVSVEVKPVLRLCLYAAGLSPSLG